MQRQITLDALPQPGEPLREKVDEGNAQLLELELAERIRKQSSRLSRRERFLLNRRWRKLQRQLIELNYNHLVTKRYHAWCLYQQLKHLMNRDQSEVRRLKQRYLFVKACGQQLNDQLEAIRHISDEFDIVNQQLRDHEELIRWEREDRENFEGFKREARTWEQQMKAVFRKSARLHHRGTDKNGSEFIEIPQFRRIIIKDDRVMYLLHTSRQTLFGKFFNKWQSALPYNVDIASLRCDETLENLSSACNRVVNVEYSNRGTNLFYVISRLDSPDGIPRKLLYQKIIDFYPVNDHDKTPWCAGVTNDRKLEWYNFEDNPHVLIAGATKGGKSNHVNQMIASMTTMNTPEELRFMLVDLKGGIEFTHWKGLQHQLRDMLTNPQSVLEGLQWLRKIMEQRLAVFESMKAKNLQSYNEKVENKLPRIVCFVDEMATLIGLGDLTKELHTELRVLSAQGRAVGINLVLCTQHSSVDVLPGWVKTNMGLRISAKMPSHQASMVILDSVTASQLPDVPGRMVFSSGRFEVIAQSPFISDEQIAKAVKQSQQFTAPDNTEFISVLPAPKPKKPEFTRDDIFKFALEMNGKLSANRIHDIVGNEVITLRNLRALVNSIKDNLENGTIEYEGVEYSMERQGRAYILKSMEQSMEQKSGETLFAS